MKATDIQRVSEIDTDIQALMSQLSELYQERSSLFGSSENPKKPAHARKRTSNLDDIDLSHIDLTVFDQ